MSDKEFYAATVEEALDKASAALGIPPDQLDFTVLDQGSSGFLGIGARDARVSVEPPEPRDGPTLDAEDGLPEHTYDEEVSPPVTEPLAISRSSKESSEAVPNEEAPHELIIAIDEFMTSLLGAMGLDATVDAYDAGDVITVDVAIKETGLFIGQKGETIDAIQYLLNIATYKNRPFSKRIVVDSEGYRQRRIEAIQGMAHRTARRALREKRPLSLPPMPAAERRVVHLFLKENPSVTTSSEGREEERRVTVSPI